MSLEVSPELLEAARLGEVPDEDFVDCVRVSLPYAWNLVSMLATRLHVDGGDFADNMVPPPSEKERGQLLRALASDSVRGALERYFGVKLAFQNCHRVAVFPKDAETTDVYRRFISTRSQLLNQTPKLRDC